MAYDDVEQSRQDAAPAELYTFITPSATYRVTSYLNDVSFGGFTFTAVPGARSTLNVVDVATDQAELVIELPASHALCQAYANGVPMREVAVTAMRYHAEFAVSLQLWSGFASGLSFKAEMGAFRVPSGTDEAIDVDVPSVAAQRLCNHILYDDMCQVARASNTINTTVTNVSTDGKTITVASVGGAIPPNLIHGELLHNTSTERRTIIDQPSGTLLVIQSPFPNLIPQIGDAVTLFYGCDHMFETCHDKFFNHLNFGGHPGLPKSNIFRVNVITGVGTSEED